jgi:hypothetical protein
MVTDKTETKWQCPKDGAAMQQMGRRSGAWRCPDCRGVFIDTAAAMPRGRGARPPWWALVVTSVLMSLLATFAIRRLRRRLGA